MRANIKHKNGHNSGLGASPASEIGENDPTMSPDVLPFPKELKINYIGWFFKVLRGHKSA